jgi:hypothetical protein
VSPILGGAIGGVVYQQVGPVILYVGASLLVLGAGAVAVVALNRPAFTRPVVHTAPSSGAPPIGIGAGLPPSEI